MAAEKVLVSPDGTREWTPQDASEAVNLKARGWREKTAKDDKPARAGN
jgi:hypothetical protein